MTYDMTIAGLRRSLPLCRVTDELFIGAFVILGDPELTVACAKALLERAPDHDYLLTCEAKSIPLIHEMARQSGNRPYLLARKSPKLYMPDALEAHVRSITTDFEQTLYLSRADAEKMRGRRILLVDDVISTGNSLKALETLVDKAGGRIAGRMAVLAEGEASRREDILFLEPLPLFRADGSPSNDAPPGLA